MDNFGIEYIGFMVRFIYVKIFKNKEILIKELWEVTKYGENCQYLKISNYNLGSLIAVILLFLALIIKFLG